MEEEDAEETDMVVRTHWWWARRLCGATQTESSIACNQSTQTQSDADPSLHITNITQSTHTSQSSQTKSSIACNQSTQTQSDADPSLQITNITQSTQTSQSPPETERSTQTPHTSFATPTSSTKKKTPQNARKRHKSATTSGQRNILAALSQSSTPTKNSDQRAICQNWIDSFPGWSACGVKRKASDIE